MHVLPGIPEVKILMKANGIPNPPIHSPVVYFSLARQIVDDYGIRQGICLDIGSGVGLLGIGIAMMTQLSVFLVDIDRHTLEGALANAKYFMVRHKITCLRADVHNLPLIDGSVNLIASRGSVLFWKDPVRAFMCINRILAPNAVAFIGGGLHRCLPREERKKLKKAIRGWFESPDAKSLLPPHSWPVSCWMANAKIKAFRTIDDNPGKWIEIRKME